MVTDPLLKTGKRVSENYSGYAMWGDWESPTGSDAVWPDLNYFVFHKVELYKGSDVQSIDQFGITVPLTSTNGFSGRFRAYLFTSDVTGQQDFPTGGYAFTYSDISLGINGSTYYTGSLPLSSRAKRAVNAADTVYIGYYAIYNGDVGDLSVKSYGTAIVESYTEKEIPPTPYINWGSFVSTNNGADMTIVNGGRYNLTGTVKTRDGNTTLFTDTVDSNGIFHITVDAVSWFNAAGVTDSFSMPIHIEITGDSPNQLSSDNYAYHEYRATAKESMRPVVSSIDKLIQQPTGFPSDYARTYISGFSKCKVTAVITRPTNALVSTVTLSYPGGRTVTMTPVSGSTDTYEGTTFSALATDTTFTVTVTDARGLSNTGTESVTGVVPYVLPSVSIDPANTYRCNSQGVKTDGGDHYKIRVIPQISTIIIDSDTGNDTNYITELTVGLKNAPAVERHTIPSGTTSDTLPPASAGDTGTLPEPKKAYVLTIIIQDRISGQITREYTLKGLQRDLVLNHDGGHTHLGVGMTPIGKDFSGYKDTIELPNDGLFLLGGMPVQAFNYPHIAGKTADNPCFGRDFHTVAFDRTGEANATAIFGFPASQYDSWSNIPEDPLDQQVSPPAGIRTYGWMGWREVYYGNEDVVLVKITELAPQAGRIWFCSRTKNATTDEYTWSRWKYLMPISV